MNVELISWTKDPIGTCAIAASMCYASEPSRKIVKGCIRSGHTSILENASFTFKITGVSRSFLAQITRHRHASFAVESQRYVSYDGVIDWVLPTNYMPYDDNTATLERVMATSCDRSLDKYQELINGYDCENDEARAVLPNAMPTNMVVTMNIRALMNFFGLRLCMRASREIRMVAKKMKESIMSCPDLTKEDRDILDGIFVPKCESFEISFCPEHKGCGKHKPLKEIVKGEYVK